MKYWLSHLPLEVWVAVFRYPWKSREKMGKIVDRIGNRKYGEYMQFYLHDWGNRKLNRIEFLQLYVFVPLYRPVPSTPMPANIKSFDRIFISRFDAQTLDFLRRIRPILDNVNLKLYTDNHNLDNLRIVLDNLAPIMDNIHSLYCCNVRALPTVRQCFGNEKFDKIKILEIYSDQGAKQATINFLMNWLQPQQREGNEPKWCNVRMYNDNGFLKQISTAICEEFLAAKSPSTFVLFIRPTCMEFKFVEFHLQNNIDEELHGVQTENGYEQNRIQIARHKINSGTKLEEWVERNTEFSREIEIDHPTIGLIDAIDPPENEDKEQQPTTSKDA